jgi:small subunit ribosomal protein S6
MSDNYYEQTYILDSVLKDDQYEEIISKYRNLIEDNGGTIDEIDAWGNQRFEYEMEGKASGYYVNTYFEAPGTLIETLEHEQQLDDNVMRSLTLKYDAKMLRHRELQKKNAVPQLVDEDEEEDEE